VQGVFALPKHSIELDPPQAWVVALAPGQAAPKHPAHHMQLVVIANAAGWQTYTGGGGLAALAEALGTTAPVPQRTTSPWPPPQGAPEFKCPSKLQKMMHPEGEEGRAPPAAASRRAPASADTVRDMADSIITAVPPRLPWQEQHILYTDGSCLDTDAGQRIGAAVVAPALKGSGHDWRWAVDPCGAGPSNTINRAELAAILCALQIAQESITAGGRVVIATDSACSLHQIRKQLHEPKALMLSKHRAILELISQAITALVCGHHCDVQFIKVKAHTGVLGNEAADELAKLTAQGQVPAGVRCIQVHAGSAPYSGLFWLAVPPNADNPAPGYLRNLNDAVTAAAMPDNATGGANIGMYPQLWVDTARHADGAVSNHAWHAREVTHAALRTWLRAKYGVLYNARIAARMNLPYLPCPSTPRGMCPLCGELDSTGHWLGGCKHPDMRALYIHRHDQLCRTIIKAARQGELGGMYMAADAGTDATLGPLGIRDKRIPPGLLPNAPSRPDILIVHDTPAALAPMLHPQAGTKRSAPAAVLGPQKVTIVEVTVQSDHTAPGATPHGRAQPKSQQHAATQAALEARGHTVDYHVIAIGRMGTVYSGYAAQAERHKGESTCSTTSNVTLPPTAGLSGTRMYVTHS